MMVHFLVVLLNCQPEDGLLKLLSELDIPLRWVEFDQELLFSLLSQFLGLLTVLVWGLFHQACLLGHASDVLDWRWLFFAREHSWILDWDFLDDGINAVLVVVNCINHVWEWRRHVGLCLSGNVVGFWQDLRVNRWVQRLTKAYSYLNVAVSLLYQLRIFARCRS